MRRFKIANVLLGLEDFLAEIPEALYRVEGEGACSFDEAAGELTVTGLVDFCTYFNGCSVGKWRRYTSLGRFSVHLELAGDACTVALVSLDAADSVSPVASEVVGVVELEASDDFSSIDLALPADCAIAGFALMTAGSVRLRNAYYYVEVEEDCIRPVRLAVSTTTFRKENFIVPNIERIKGSAFAVGEKTGGRFHMFVVDNGRTLDVDALSDERVTVIPNPNVGGAGGFARGMMAALEHPADFTHVILMDDDVRMSPESFQRTFALLSLVSDEYASACVNGAMLELERPWLQYEDVSRARAEGGYERVKWDFRITSQADVVHNEIVDVEVPHAYGAWWYSCIPLDLVRKKGLPMPFFVRCDDVEFGVRLGARYMTMNGICVWHSRFDTRFNAAVDLYQYGRNMMATMALHDDFFDQDAFMRLFWRVFHLRLRRMEYESVELWLDGLDDYLKGPEFLMQVDGSEVLSENSARGEKLVDVSEIDSDVLAALDYDIAWLSRPEKPAFRNSFDKVASKAALTVTKLVWTIPYDRHLLPDALLVSKPGVIMPGDCRSPWWATAARRRLVALNADASKGHVRTLDRDRYRRLTERFHDLMRRYREDGAKVAARWREKMPEMTSEEFWIEYLERLS